jgi:hypothetical protein
MTTSVQDEKQEDESAATTTDNKRVTEADQARFLDDIMASFD